MFSFDVDNRLLRAVHKQGYSQATSVQQQCIPAGLCGADVLACAPTGSGKTLAYALPLLHRALAGCGCGVKALVLLPSKELAVQVSAVLASLAVYTDLKLLNLADAELNPSALLPLIASLPDIIVSTPSKVLSVLNNLDLSNLQTLVLDEADLILSFGYEDDIRKIFSVLKLDAIQAYLFSATLSGDIESIAPLILKSPFTYTPPATPTTQLTQYFLTTPDKYLLTYFLLKLKIHPFHSKSIIFVNDIDTGYKLKIFLNSFGVQCCVLSNQVAVKSRMHVVQEFERGVYEYLVAVDDEENEVDISDDSDSEHEQDAPDPSKNNKKKKKEKKKGDVEYGISRGIDFKNVKSVINFDLPKTTAGYMHRIGRTARAFSNGVSLTFVTPTPPPQQEQSLKKRKKEKKIITEEHIFAKIKKQQEKLGRTIEEFKIDMTQVEGFRYRCNDALRAVTKSVVKEVRIKELKTEILNSEKLKAHFEDNPQDLHALRHDKPVHVSRHLPELKHIPMYLMPKRKSAMPTTKTSDGNTGTDDVSFGDVMFGKLRKGKSNNRKKGGGVMKGKSGKSNPLKSFRYKK